MAFLDPTDGVGVGHTLLVTFLYRGEEGDDELAREIAEAQSCKCPYHLYSRALLSYRLSLQDDGLEIFQYQSILGEPE